MVTRRSGAPSRFLFHRAPESWVLPGDLLIINGLFGFLPLFAAVFGFASCGADAARALLDPSDPIHLLSRPLGPHERGAVHVSGRIQGGEVCLVTHEHFDKLWTEDWVGIAGQGVSVLVERGEGAGAPAAGTTLAMDWTTTRWEPRPALEKTTREQRWRAPNREEAALPPRFSRIPREGRILEGCRRPGDPVFVDVALDADQLTLITPGDGTPRLRLAQLRASLVGQASLIGLAVVVALLYLWRVIVARPFTATLLLRLTQPLILTVAPPALFVLAFSPLLVLAGTWVVPWLTGADGAVAVDRGLWACAHGAAIAGVIVAVRMRDRLLELHASMSLVRTGACPRLDRARQDEAVCFEAAVDAGAPVSAGLLTGEPRAHWLVSVIRIVKSGNTSSSVSEPDRAGPLLVPLRGDGEALLDLTHVAADLRAVRRIVRARSARRGAFAAVLGPAPPAGSYLLEERFLDPGEAVLVMGRVIRFEATPGRPGEVPVIGGSERERVLVHAGSRRSLLRGLAVERGFLVAAIAICLAVPLAIAALAAWAISA